MNIRRLLKRGLHTLAICSMMILIAGCSKEKTQDVDEDIIISPMITPSGDPTPSPTPILMTPAPGVTLTPTPELEPTVTPIVLLTKTEAEAKLKANVDTTTYFYELAEDNLNIDGITYFKYVLYDKGVELHPYIIIDRTNGALSLYDTDGNITAFTKFPVDKVEKVDSQEEEITVDDALVMLKRVTKEKLGLPKNLSNYTIIADEWTTVVNGEACYCFNVFEGSEEGQLVAMYYVSTSGTAIYTFDEENGEFVLCD